MRIRRLGKIKHENKRRMVEPNLSSLSESTSEGSKRVICCRGMQKQSTSKPSKCLPGGFLPIMLCLLLFVSFLIFITSTSNIPYLQFMYSTAAGTTNDHVVLPYSLHNQISHLQTRLGVLLEQLHTENSESKAVAKFSDQLLGIAMSLDKLANSLSEQYMDPPTGKTETSNVDEDLSEAEEDEAEERSQDGKIFNSGELYNYTSTKPHRLDGKKNFLGVEAINPSIGSPCAHMAWNIDQFMTYKIFATCPDDWDMAQKLLAGGCDPLPRRRCFARSPPHYSKPHPINSSLWTQPSDVNILWNKYKCKDYSCLVSNETLNRRGFFKCSDCFVFSKQKWETPKNESVSAEFTIDEVLSLKPGEIRIGLDFSPTTGTFAAMMRERNVTIASATLNLGAPFNEVIALRGLLPLYISIGSRLPFFDNTLDIIHSTLFLDGWIGVELLQFMLFDWDRVLRPKGILWVDRFFCKKEDMKMYLEEFSRLGYRKLLWRVLPKMDKLGDELFFSAVLEKPLSG